MTKGFRYNCTVESNLLGETIALVPLAHKLTLLLSNLGRNTCDTRALAREIADTSVKDWSALLALDADALLQHGVTDIRLETIDPAARFASWSPFKVVGVGQKLPTGLPQPSDNPSFVLSKDGAAKYAIINGTVIDLQKPLADQMEELSGY